MIIKPNNGIEFTKDELLKLFLNTVKDITERNEDMICSIRCYAEKLNAGADMSIRRIKGLDKETYLLFDLDIIGTDKMKHIISAEKKKGPIIIEPNTDMIKIACQSLVASIISTQNVCLKTDSKLILSFLVEKDDSNFANVIKGKINNIKNISEEVLEKIEANNSRYIEIEFTLDEPRKSYLLYIYITRDKHVGIPIYIINVSGNTTMYSIVTVKEDFYIAFNGWVDKIYADFRNVSSDPAVMVKYYTISENKELI